MRISDCHEEAESGIRMEREELMKHEQVGKNVKVDLRQRTKDFGRK
jgi:hypothetical protein